MGLKFNAILWWIVTYKFSYMRGEIKDPIKMYLQIEFNRSHDDPGQI
jgi:hypothetical protein